MLQKRVTLVGLLQAAALVTILFSFVTSFDHLHFNIELFSHFRLQYLAISLVLFIFFAAARNLALGALLLVTVALNASYVLPWYFGGDQQNDSAAIKLLHVNVLSTNDDYDRLFELVAAEQPDLIFLLELTPEWLEATRPLQEDYPFTYTEPRADNFGIGLFSRLPLESVRHVDSPPLNYPTLIATLTVHGELLTLIDTHPMIPLGRANVEARNEHLESVATLARQVERPVMLIGDFNTTVWTGPYRALEASTGLRNTRKGFGILPTWSTFMPFAMIAIDHALVSDGIGVVETRTGARIGSDHLPLILTVAL